MSEDGVSRTSERENNCRRSSLYFWVFTFAIDAHSISEEVVGFSPLWFPRGKYLFLLSLVIIDVRVILSGKILNHIELICKNLTWSQS